MMSCLFIPCLCNLFRRDCWLNAWSDAGSDTLFTFATLTLLNLCLIMTWTEFRTILCTSKVKLHKLLSILHCQNVFDWLRNASQMRMSVMKSSLESLESWLYSASLISWSSLLRNSTSSRDFGNKRWLAGRVHSFTRVHTSGAPPKLMRKCDIHRSLVEKVSDWLTNFRFSLNFDYLNLHGFGWFIYDFSRLISISVCFWCVEKYSEESLNHSKVKESTDVTENVFHKQLLLSFFFFFLLVRLAAAVRDRLGAKTVLGATPAAAVLFWWNLREGQVTVSVRCQLGTSAPDELVDQSLSIILYREQPEIRIWVNKHSLNLRFNLRQGSKQSPIRYSHNLTQNAAQMVAKSWLTAVRITTLRCEIS